MRKLYRKLAVTVVLSALVIMAFFTVSLYERSRRENYNYLSQLLSGAEANIKSAQADYREKLELLKEDYQNRAWAVEYILSDDSGQIDRTGLVILKNLMEVAAISLVDNSGQVVLTTEENREEAYENPKELEKLLASGEENAALVHVEEPAFDEKPSAFYVLARAKSDRYGAVRVDADLSRLGLMSQKELIENTLRQAITEYATSIVAIDKDSGRIVGITEDEGKLTGMDSGKAPGFLRLAREAEEGKLEFFRLEGRSCMGVVREQEGMYLAALSAPDRFFRDMLWKFAEGVAGIGAVSLLTVLMVRYHLKKHLFQSLEQMKEGIRKVLQGERDIVLEEGELPEIQSFMETIRELKNQYIDKAEGMDRMEGELTQAQTEAKYDKLTGLYNRSGFERQVEEFLRQSNPVGVLVLFDLDNFKRINDSEGHPEGDRILERFAVCLNQGFRKSDYIGRLGGDEFVVLMPGSIPGKILEEKLQAVLERVREALKFYYERYAVSVSAGAVPVDGTIKSYEALYRCADTALYIAKYLGKDRFYINEKKISCMKEECVRCRKDCPRSRLLKLREKEE